jgi:Glycosyl transferase family 90
MQKGAWGKHLEHLAAVGRKTPWRERARTFFWRGRLQAGGHTDGPRELAIAALHNGTFAEYFAARNVSLDIKDAFGAHSPNIVPAREWARYKYILFIRGTTYSASLRYMLLTGSPIIGIVGEYTEFYARALKDGEHWLVLPEPLDQQTAAPVLDRLMARDGGSAAAALAERLGSAGRAWVERELTPKMVSCYWARVVVRYAKRYAAIQEASRR